MQKILTNMLAYVISNRSRNISGHMLLLITLLCFMTVMLALKKEIAGIHCQSGRECFSLTLFGEVMLPWRGEGGIDTCLEYLFLFGRRRRGLLKERDWAKHLDPRQIRKKRRKETMHWGKHQNSYININVSIQLKSLFKFDISFLIIT